MKFKLNKAVYNKKIETFRNEDSISFHQYLTEPLKLKPGDRMLDLGCGQGQTLVHILKKLKNGKAYGFDLSENLLAVAEKYLSKYIVNGKLELIKGNATEKLPFKDKFFDKIVCHNVLECIPDKVSFVNECFRMLKKDGTLVLSHSDFDTIVFNSSLLTLNRKLIHTYTDTTQGWMEISDGLIGRKLAGIFHKTKFKNFEPDTYCMTNVEFNPRKYGFGVAKSIADIGLKLGRFKKIEIKKWLADLKKLNRKKEYFFSININMIVAKK
jgi:ubiquinone/menaquinone biosynthesis C-methylase UbiE